MLRALKRQHKISGMSLQYSGAGTEDVTQMKGAAGGDSRSNRRQSDEGLAAIYKAARCLHGSWDHRWEAPMSPVTWLTEQSGTIHLPSVSSQVMNLNSAEQYN